MGTQFDSLPYFRFRIDRRLLAAFDSPSNEPSSVPSGTTLQVSVMPWPLGPTLPPSVAVDDQRAADSMRRHSSVSNEAVSGEAVRQRNGDRRDLRTMPSPRNGGCSPLGHEGYGASSRSLHRARIF